MKWSPDRKHFLRTDFRGDRKQLYRDIVKTLGCYDVSIIGSVHNLNECHGTKLHRWDLSRAKLWATTQQFRNIAERFEKPFLELNHEHGIIIADKYSEHKGELALLKDMTKAITEGTTYRKFDRICMNPIMAFSDYCPPLQISDIIIGIIVGALSQNRYAQEYIDEMTSWFLKDPHTGSISFSSSISSSILGYGLILFPKEFRVKGMRLFKKADLGYIYAEKGITKRLK